MLHREGKDFLLESYKDGSPVGVHGVGGDTAGIEGQFRVELAPPPQVATGGLLLLRRRFEELDGAPPQSAEPVTDGDEDREDMAVVPWISNLAVVGPRVVDEGPRADVEAAGVVQLGMHGHDL